MLNQIYVSLDQGVSMLMTQIMTHPEGIFLLINFVRSRCHSLAMINHSRYSNEFNGRLITNLIFLLINVNTKFFVDFHYGYFSLI